MFRSDVTLSVHWAFSVRNQFVVTTELVRNTTVTTEFVFGQKYNCHRRVCVRSEIQLSPQSLCSVRNTIVTTDLLFGQEYTKLPLG